MSIPDDQPWEYFNNRQRTSIKHSYIPLKKKDIVGELSTDDLISLDGDYPFIKILKQSDWEHVLGTACPPTEARGTACPPTQPETSEARGSWGTTCPQTEARGSWGTCPPPPLESFLPIVIDENSPECEYKRRDKFNKDNASEKIVHWGQLKLLMSEINFFNRVYEDNNFTWPTKLVVYAGSAPGTHICYLSMMFPHFKFVLIDPRDIEFPKCYQYDNYNTLYVSEHITQKDIDEFLSQEMNTILYIKGYMSAVLSTVFKTYNALFISDIRSIEDKRFSEIAVLYDSLLHIDIIKNMSPSYSLIKSHCTYSDEVSRNLEDIKKAQDSSFIAKYRNHPYYDLIADGKYSKVTPFPQGIFYTQCWAGLSSSEIRLFVKGTPPIICYDNKKFEDKLYYYNNVRRVAQYPNLINLFESDECIKMNRSLDTHYHVYILLKYISLFDKSRELLISIINNEKLRQLPQDTTNNTNNTNNTIKSMSILEFVKYVTLHMCKNITLSGKRTLEWREWKDWKDYKDYKDINQEF